MTDGFVDLRFEDRHVYGEPEPSKCVHCGLLVRSIGLVLPSGDTLYIGVTKEPHPAVAVTPVRVHRSCPACQRNPHSRE